MENSRLFKILGSLSRDEIKELEKFLNSPYFSRGRDCVPFFLAIRSCWPKFSGAAPAKSAVYEKLFPGKTYGDKKSVSIFSTLSSELYRLTKEFLIYSNLKSDERGKKLFLLRKLLDKKLYTEFEREYKDTVTDNTLNENSERRGSAANFFESFRLNYIYNEYAWQRSDMEELYNGLMRSANDAIAFAIITAYKFMDTKDTASVTFNIKTGHTFTDILLESLDNEKMLSELKKYYPELYPYISANHLVYMMNRNKGEMNDESLLQYRKLKDTIDKNSGAFGHREKYMLYQALENYMAIRLEQNQQEKENYKELFDIYKRSLDEGVYKVSKESSIEPTVFRNILMTACDMNEFSWAESFIEKYSAELPDEFALSMKSHAYGTLYFNKGEFEKALKHIVNIKYDYLRHKIDVKVLQFKIFYELGSYESAFNLLDTLRHYFSSSEEISPLVRTRFSGFIKYAGELLRSRTAVEKAGKKINTTEEIFARLQKESAVESATWLANKLKEL
jgi:hypothetical protein